MGPHQSSLYAASDSCRDLNVHGMCPGCNLNVRLLQAAVVSSRADAECSPRLCLITTNNDLR